MFLSDLQLDLSRRSGAHHDFCLLSFFLSPLSFNAVCHLFAVVPSFFCDSVSRERSSAQSASLGNPSLHSLLMVSSTIMSRSGLTADPLCTPTPIWKLSLSPWGVLIFVVAPSYVHLISRTSFSGIPFFLWHHHTSSLGTLSKAFSRSIKAW